MKMLVDVSVSLSRRRACEEYQFEGFCVGRRGTYQVEEILLDASNNRTALAGVESVPAVHDLPVPELLVLVVLGGRGKQRAHERVVERLEEFLEVRRSERARKSGDVEGVDGLNKRCNRTWCARCVVRARKVEARRPGG